MLLYCAQTLLPVSDKFQPSQDPSCFLYTHIAKYWLVQGTDSTVI